MQVLFRLFSSSMSQDRKKLNLWNPHLFLMSRPEWGRVGSLPPPHPVSSRTCGQRERGAPRGHIWQRGCARVTKTLIHRRSCRHNNRSPGVLATLGRGLGAAASGGTRREWGRSTRAGRCKLTRGREGATHVAAAVPAGGDRAGRRASEQSRAEPRLYGPRGARCRCAAHPQPEPELLQNQAERSGASRGPGPRGRAAPGAGHGSPVAGWRKDSRGGQDPPSEDRQAQGEPETANRPPPAAAPPGPSPGGAHSRAHTLAHLSSAPAQPRLAPVEAPLGARCHG